MSTQEQDFQWTDKLVIEFAVNWMKERVAFAITNDLAAAPLPIQLSVERFKDEKVEKRSPEYEVLELICNNTAKTTWERNKSVYKDKEEWVKCFLNANIGWAIHSVRRLSDGEVFTLGETLSGFLDDEEKIEAFLPNTKGNALWLSTDAKRGYGCALSVAEKKEKRPIFTTEDGVDIYEGGEIWQVSVVSNYTIHRMTARPEILPPPSYFKYFCKQYNAERYAMMNKRCLSMNEVMDLFQDNSESFEKFLGAVTQLAKEKL